MTNEELKLLEKWATIYNHRNDFVWLREDEFGKYLEYVFNDGVPHNNRCLHQHVIGRSPSEKDSIPITNLPQINEVYRLDEYCCHRSHLSADDPNYCAAGHPCKSCLTNMAYNWTEEYPGYCACWDLTKTQITDYYINITDIDKFNKIY